MRQFHQRKAWLVGLLLLFLIMGLRFAFITFFSFKAGSIGDGVFFGIVFCLQVYGVFHVGSALRSR